MRFHVVSLPHTQTTENFSACAFTQKVIRFCTMMKSAGAEVFLYAGEKNSSECDELISCVSEEERLVAVGDKHYTEADWGHPVWGVFNKRVIEAMNTRLKPGDFICVIGGYSHKPIADAFPNNPTVEFGIGYPGSFSKYRVFESYAWMHMSYGANGNIGAVDGQWLDAVIPNQVDSKQFVTRPKEDYALFVGRLIDRKGYAIAQDVCKKLGKRLILAGPGEQKGYGEFAGEVGPEQRGELMARASMLFTPTVYVEPFGTVTIEAMASGTPVISTDWGAFTETVIEGVTGFRCRTFKEFCDAAITAPTLDSTAIREYALNRFSMETVGGQYVEYFTRLSSVLKDGWYKL
jgi:glycosyltransferase involved in cell wall biosynthesis